MDSASRLSVFWRSNVHSNLVRRSLCAIRLRLARFFLFFSLSLCLRLFRSSPDLFQEVWNMWLTCFVNVSHMTSHLRQFGHKRQKKKKKERFLVLHNESCAFAVLHLKPLAANWLIRLWMCI